MRYTPQIEGEDAFVDTLMAAGEEARVYNNALWRFEHFSQKSFYGI